ncbi:transmembrane protein 170A isoform X3 [Callithrix jacchus]
MEPEGSGGSAGLLQQILSLKLVPRVGNGTLCPNSTSLCSFPGTARPAPAHYAPRRGFGGAVGVRSMGGLPCAPPIGGHELVAQSSSARKNCPCSESWREERGLHLGRRRKALRGGAVICVDLERDVVWCVPVGTGVFSLLSCPRWITGPLHPQTSQIWCSYCWSLPSSREGNDTI